MDTKRRSRQVMYPQTRAVPIQPTGGMWRYTEEGEFPPNSSPDMLNCFVYEGRLCKRPGYSVFPTGMSSLGGQIMGIYATQDDEYNTHLIACTAAGVSKYDFALNLWAALTGPAMAGGDTQWFTFETSQNSIVFCQGVDKILRHDISTVATTYAVLNANAPITRYLTRFADRLFAAYTVETGVTKPFRIRRPVASDHTDWTGAGSGFSDQTEYPYQLRGIRKLGEGMIAYTERSIHMAERTGQVLAPYTLRVKTEGVGLYAERTLKPLPGSTGHIFMGNDDIYNWNGVQERGVALPIRDYIFNQVTPSAIRANFSEVMSDTKEYLLFACQGGATTPNAVWVYNYGRDIWYPWSISGPTCATLCRNDDTTTIDDLVGTIDAQNWEYDSRLLASAYPMLITGHTDGKVYRWGQQYSGDNGAAINCYWTSRDLESDDITTEVPPSRITLKSLGIKYKDTGANCTVQLYFSTNGGGSWVGPYSLSLNTTGTPGGNIDAIFDDYQVTGDRVRFKFVNNTSDESFQIIEFNPVLELREPIQT